MGSPLCIDLDQTLARGDVFERSLWGFLKATPWKFPLIFYWWAKGVAYLKYQLELATDCDVGILHYNQALISYIKAERSKGRRTILITGSTEAIARKVALHTQIFDEYHGSSQTYNMVGPHKAQFLIRLLGDKGYTYAGDSVKDIFVWKHAAEAIVVSDNPLILKGAQQVCEKVWKF